MLAVEFKDTLDAHIAELDIENKIVRFSKTRVVESSPYDYSIIISEHVGDIVNVCHIKTPFSKSYFASYIINDYDISTIAVPERPPWLDHFRIWESNIFHPSAPQCVKDKLGLFEEFAPRYEGINVYIDCFRKLYVFMGGRWVPLSDAYIKENLGTGYFPDDVEEEMSVASLL